MKDPRHDAGKPGHVPRTSPQDITIASGSGPNMDVTVHTGARRPPGSGATSAGNDVTIASGEVRTTAPRLPTIEGYTITGVLGQGGMGIVYRAVQAKLNRAVALKVLPAMIGSANPAAVHRFRREATAAAKLHHTNIIPIYDFGESPDAYYYAMELVNGEPLDSLIERFTQKGVTNPTVDELAKFVGDRSVSGATISADGSLGPADSGARQAAATARGRVYFQQVARWMSAAAEALHYAHTQDIIHRDVKPANLILCVDGRIMLADFGLAKSSEDHSVTMTGSVVGTLRYLSPEQAMAKRMKVDHRTDIWSLGATMYELLCYHPAFPGDDQKDILSRILTRDPASPRKLNGHVPPELDTICMKCLEKSPTTRYETAQHLADDLKRYVNDLPIAAKRPSALRRTAKFVRRHKAPVAVVTAVVLLVTATTFWRTEMAARRAAQAAARVAQIAGYNDSAIAFVSTSKAEKNWLSAEEELKHALEIDPNHVQTLLTLAWLKLEHYKALPEHAGLKSQEQVIDVCNKILSFDSKNVRALDYLGIALRRLERYDEAIPVLQKSVELKPDAYASWSNLGTLYAVTGDLKTAEKHMRRGVEIAGKEQDKWHAVAWRNLAVLEWLLGKPEASEHIANALYCSPIETQSWIIRALIGLDQTDPAAFGEALDDAKHADRLANFSEAHAKRVLALAHLKNGQPEAAAVEARKAVELGDEPTVNQLILAVSAAMTGQQDAASSHLSQAENVWPDTLRVPGAFQARADTGDLWIERAADRIGLQRLISAKPE